MAAALGQNIPRNLHNQPASASASAASRVAEAPLDHATLLAAGQVFKNALLDPKFTIQDDAFKKLSRTHVVQVLRNVVETTPHRQQVIQFAIMNDHMQLALELLAAIQPENVTPMLDAMLKADPLLRMRINKVKAIISSVAQLEKEYAVSTIAQTLNSKMYEDIISFLEYRQRHLPTATRQFGESAFRILLSTKQILDAGQAKAPGCIIGRFFQLSPDDVKFVSRVVLYVDAAKPTAKQQVMNLPIAKLIVQCASEIAVIIQAHNEKRFDDAFKACELLNKKDAHMIGHLSEGLKDNPEFFILFNRFNKSNYKEKISKLISENKFKEVLELLASLPFDAAFDLVKTTDNKMLIKSMEQAAKHIAYFSKAASSSDAAEISLELDLPRELKTLFLTLIKQEMTRKSKEQKADKAATTRWDALQPLLQAFTSGAPSRECIKPVIEAPSQILDQVAFFLEEPALLNEWRQVKAMQTHLQNGAWKQAMSIAFTFEQAFSQLVLDELRASDPIVGANGPLFPFLEELNTKMRILLDGINSNGFPSLELLLNDCSEAEMGGWLLDIANDIAKNYKERIDPHCFEVLQRFLRLFLKCENRLLNVYTALTTKCGPDSRAMMWRVLTKLNPTKVFDGVRLEGDIPGLFEKIYHAETSKVRQADDTISAEKVLYLMKAMQEKNQPEFWRRAFQTKLFGEELTLVHDWAGETYPQDKAISVNIERNNRYFGWFIAEGELNKDKPDLQMMYKLCKQRNLLQTAKELEATRTEIVAALPNWIDRVANIAFHLEQFIECEEKYRTALQKGSPSDIIEAASTLLIHPSISLRETLTAIADSSNPLTRLAHEHYLFRAKARGRDLESRKNYTFEKIAIDRKTLLAIPLEQVVKIYEFIALLTFNPDDDIINKYALELQKAAQERNRKQLITICEQVFRINQTNHIAQLFANICLHNPKLSSEIKTFFAEQIVRLAFGAFIKARKELNEERTSFDAKLKALRAPQPVDLAARRASEETLFDEQNEREDELFQVRAKQADVLHGMCKQLGKEAFALLLDKIMKEHHKEYADPKAVVQETIGLVEYTIDRTHFKKGVVAVDIPAKPEMSSMNEALELFDSITFYDPAKRPSYNPKELFPEYEREFSEKRAAWKKELEQQQPTVRGEALEKALDAREKKELPLFIRGKLQSIINIVTSRNVDFGPSNPEAFYIPYENGFIHIMRALKEGEKQAGNNAEALVEAKAKTANALFTLVRSNGYCYTRMREINLDIYLNVVLKQSTGFEDRILRELAEYRNLLFRSAVTPDSYQSVHYLTRAIQELGTMYGVPGTQEFLKGGRDNFLMGAAFSAERDSSRFEGVYTVPAIADWVHDSLSQKYRDEYKAWWSARVPADWSVKEVDAAKKKVQDLRALGKKEEELPALLVEELSVPHTIVYEPAEMVEAASKKGVVKLDDIVKAETAYKAAIEAITTEKRREMQAAKSDMKKMQAAAKAAQSRVIAADKELETALQQPKRVARTANEMIEEFRFNKFSEQVLFEIKPAGKDAKEVVVPTRNGVLMFLQQLQVIAS